MWQQVFYTLRNNSSKVEAFLFATRGPSEQGTSVLTTATEDFLFAKNNHVRILF